MSREVNLSLVIVLILSMLSFVAAACGPASAQEVTPTPVAAESVYPDPQGRFTVPIPTNWIARQADGYGVLTGPNQEITMYVLALEGNDIDTAIEEAWRMVNPAFNPIDKVSKELPTIGGVEEVRAITYQIEDKNRFIQGLGQLHNGMVYLMMIDAPLDAVQQRSSQVMVVQSGYAITALKEVDLSEVEPLPLTEEMLADFERYIEEVRERFNVPGAAVAVVQGDEIVYANGFGVRDFESGRPVTPDTQMMIGSTTKSFTTMLMADLVDEGLMDWDTPAVELLPSFALADPAWTEQITVRHLVCNCTGVSQQDEVWLFNAGEMSAEDVIESLETVEIFTGFGEAFQYSNQMIAAGGYAAAAAAGGESGHLYDAYAEALQQHILTPLSMTQTTLSVADVEARDNYATPHDLTLDLDYYPLPLSAEQIVQPMAPANGLWSTASDMARYLITQLNRGITPDGERVVSADNLMQAWQPQVQVSADTDYGLGWFVSDYKGQPVIYHPGGTFGFTADLAFLPEADLGLTILVNGQKAMAFTEAVRYRLLELVFDQPPEYEALATFNYNQLQQEYAETQLAETLDPDAVAPYLGLYSHLTLGNVTLALAEGGHGLLLDVGEFGGEFRPVAGEPDRFVAYAAPAMTGTPIQLAGADENKPQLIFGVGLGVGEYTFEKVAEIEE